MTIRSDTYNDATICKSLESSYELYVQEGTPDKIQLCYNQPVSIGRQHQMDPEKMPDIIVLYQSVSRGKHVTVVLQLNNCVELHVCDGTNGIHVKDKFYPKGSKAIFETPFVFLVSGIECRVSNNDATIHIVNNSKASPLSDKQKEIQMPLKQENEELEPGDTSNQTIQDLKQKETVSEPKTEVSYTPSQRNLSSEGSHSIKWISIVSAILVVLIIIVWIVLNR